MKTTCVVLALTLVLAAVPTAPAQDYVLRTWATPGAAPANGEPTSSSASFVMRSRLGGPFAGHAESASFALWGCSAYTPIEAAFFAVAAGDPEDLTVTLRWTVESLAGIAGFNVYRASQEGGPFERINSEMLAAESPGMYEDRTVWPGSRFWYELWVVLPDGTEEKALHEPVVVTTGGVLETKLCAASPNPFGAETVMELYVASDSGSRLTIFDVAGRVVKTFEVEGKRPGRYTITWDGTNDSGQRVASGVYYCALEAGGKRDTRPIVLLR